MKKFNILFISLVAVLLLGLTACNDDEFETEYSSTYPFNGEWHVYEGYVANDTFHAWYGPYWLNIYNTADDNGIDIWIENLYDSGIKCKAQITGDNSFTASISEDIGGVVDFVSITGKIINDDSLAMEIYLFGADSLGNVTDTIDIYNCHGARKTGFE